MTNETASEITPRNNVLGNVPEMSVSELAFSLKRTLEETYGRIRIRGELSGVKVAASGHMYADMKDEGAVINIVCWKGVMSRLSLMPEDGMDVICTGKVTSYPKGSRYQIVIDSIELAGEGALLKMLEDRKKKLAAEGLFAPERKKPLPFIPHSIGVVTSPTGAVIRDILHRLADRFPRPVLIWPVPVQGDNAADKIAAAIKGFDSIQSSGAMRRPDLLIVARGGGSLEDLMAFNEESVVRAVADCSIPVISAVGHETDTTLIDYVSDLRAPTPTGAAEMAVPVRANLRTQILDDEKRLVSGISRLFEEMRHRLTAQAARLGDPGRILEVKTQSLDHLSQKLVSGFERGLSGKRTRMLELGAMLRHPKDRIAEAQKILSIRTDSLMRVRNKLLDEPQKRFVHAGRMLETLSFKSVLNRGFVVVRDDQGKPVTAADQTRTGQSVRLQFEDDKLVDAVIGKGGKSKKPAKADSQGQLF